MATNTTTKKSGGSTAAKPKTATATATKIETPVAPVAETKPAKAKTFDVSSDAIVNVKSNVFGGLIFVNPKNGYSIEWDAHGDVQQMTLGDLREMRSSSIGFFANQWIIIMGFADENADEYSASDIYHALYVDKYYQSMIDPDNYEQVCKWSVDEIAEKCALLSISAKENLAVALNMYIEKGLLDSLKSIKAFEKALGCELRMPE